MIQIWQVPSECGPSNLVILDLGHWNFCPLGSVLMLGILEFSCLMGSLDFPSWTVSMWRFMSVFRQNKAGQIVHCVFFPSWAVSKCLFNSPLRANEAVQLGHWVRFFSWTVWMCRFKSVFLERSRLHSGHGTFCFWFVDYDTAHWNSWLVVAVVDVFFLHEQIQCGVSDHFSVKTKLDKWHTEGFFPHEHFRCVFSNHFCVHMKHCN